MDPGNIKLVLLSALFAAGIGSASAEPAAKLPPMRIKNGIEYVTGGQFSGDVRAFEQAALRYPIALELVRREPGREIFLSGARVTLLDAGGRHLLTVDADGPFFLAQVPAGRYRVSATYDGRTESRDLVVPRPGGQSPVLIEWPGLG